MYTLIIDTSTERGLIALASGLNVFFKEELPFGVFNSKILMPTIESTFQKLGLKPQDLRAVSVGIGPGSFTGIRVGASLAIGLCFGAHIPLISFSSLSGFISHEEGPFISFIDAKVGGAYVLFQENKKGQIFETSKPQIVALENLPKNITFVGPNFQRLKFENAIEKHPDASHLAYLTEEKIKNNQFSKGMALELLYLRSTSL